MVIEFEPLVSDPRVRNIVACVVSMLSISNFEVELTRFKVSNMNDNALKIVCAASC
jgi:hypothetical protein